MLEEADTRVSPRGWVRPPGGGSPSSLLGEGFGAWLEPSGSEYPGGLGGGRGPRSGAKPGPRARTSPEAPLTREPRRGSAPRRRKPLLASVANWSWPGSQEGAGRGRLRSASGGGGRNTRLQGCLGRRAGPGTRIFPRSLPPPAPRPPLFTGIPHAPDTPSCRGLSGPAWIAVVSRPPPPPKGRGGWSHRTFAPSVAAPGPGSFENPALAPPSGRGKGRLDGACQPWVSRPSLSQGARTESRRRSCRRRVGQPSGRPVETPGRHTRYADRAA